MEQYTPTFGSVEYFICALNGILSTYMGAVYRILANVHASSMLNFWNRTVALFHFMGEHGINVREHSDVFESSRKFARNRLIFYGIYGSTVLFVTFVYPLLAHTIGWRHIGVTNPPPFLLSIKIGRASCRERV